MSDYLNHYGVLGMKWGKRKAGSSTESSKKRKPSLPDSADYTESRAIQKKKPNQMSNAELRKVNERIRLEQEYSRLNPTKISQGLSYVKSITDAVNTGMNAYNAIDRAAGVAGKVNTTVPKRPRNGYR